MSYPRLEINLRKLEYNARFEVASLAQHGITVMGVNKVFNGCVETAAALVRGGIEVVAESRVYNLKKLAGLPCLKCLLRSPSLSEIGETISYADISLNSEIPVLQALSREAVRQNRQHWIMLMIDFGDIREGIWFENRREIEAAVQAVLDLPNLSLYSLGTNFNCFGTALPTAENGRLFVELARSLEALFRITIPYLSGGNCTSFHLVDKGIWPEGINNLRIGGLHQYGIEYVNVKYVDGYYHSAMDVERVASNLYILKAEIIELNTKPTVPYGELGVDAFLQKKSFVDRGRRKRALLALGRQDLPSENIWPVDPRIEILGQTSDHTIIDIEDCHRDYRVGDTVAFEIDYTALLAACNSPGVEKVFVDD